MSCELKSNDELDIEERDKEIDRLEKECDRLRHLVKLAYHEGYRERDITNKYINHLHDMQSQRDRLWQALAEANQLLIRYLSPKLPSPHETLELVTKIATLQEAEE